MMQVQGDPLEVRHLINPILDPLVSTTTILGDAVCTLLVLLHPIGGCRDWDINLLILACASILWIFFLLTIVGFVSILY